MSSPDDQTELRFPREELLQQAVANLFARMDWVSGIQILQGSQEHGKDLVFKSHGGLHEAMVCACVVKNRPFTGVAGRRGNLRSVIEQAEQAFNIPFIDEQRREVFVDTVYIINPFPTTAAAAKSIQGALPKRRIVLLTGMELVRMFQQHWPTYLRDEASILSQFERGLEDVADSARALKALQSDHGVSGVFAERPVIFVPVAFERELRLYSIERDAYDVLGVKKSKNARTRESVADLSLRLAELAFFLRHLEEWSFPGVRFVPKVSEVTSQLANTVKKIEEATLRAYSSAIGKPVYSLNQIPPEVTVSLLDEDSTEISRLSAEATLAARLQMAQVEERLRGLLAASAKFRLQADQDSLLDDVDFREACMVDDCLRALPQAKVVVVEKFNFEFSTELHRKTKQSLLIVGGPGLGKTTFCTRNALIDATRVLAGGRARRPAYVALHHAAKVEAKTFAEQFLAESRRSAVLLDAEAYEGDIRLYLDGFDEIATSKRRGEVLQIARNGVAEDSKRQVIITSRDSVSDACLSWLPRVRLSLFSITQIEQLAKQWLNSESVTDEFMEQLRAAPALMELARVPLLATVTILVFQRTRRIPRDRTRLYQVFSDLLCGGWDLAKGIVRGSEFGLVPKRAVLEMVAYNAHCASATDFEDGAIELYASRVMPSQPAWMYERMRKELEVDGIIARNGNQLYFSHLSFQEYFAARYIRQVADERIHERLVMAAGKSDPWWQEVMKFYIEMHTGRESALARLRTLAARRGMRQLDALVYQVFPKSAE